MPGNDVQLIREREHDRISAKLGSFNKKRYRAHYVPASCQALNGLPTVSADKNLKRIFIERVRLE